MDSTWPPDESSIFSKLIRASDKLASAAAKLSNAMRKCDQLAQVYPLDQRLPEKMWECSLITALTNQHIDRLVSHAEKLRYTVLLLSEDIASQAATASTETFRRFPCLPPELRDMVWEAACRPPSCAHYFATLKPTPGNGGPAAHYLGDKGLWTACKEARRAITRVYRRRGSYLSTVGCFQNGQLTEEEYERLADFNKRGDRFKRWVVLELGEDLKKAYCPAEERRRRVLRLMPLNAKIATIDALKELYEMETAAPLREDAFLPGPLTQLCAELRAGNLF